MDLRLPIGYLFTLFGLIVAGYGAISDRSIYAASLGININLYWGIVMLVFGLIMAAFGRRASVKGPRP